jgi:two-component system, chemotaxis family, chemotaxis protein CheY
LNGENKMVDMNINILIVDDYKTMLRIVRSLLNQIGFNNIDDASDGAMALEKIKEKHYELVISDWNMEPMTGLELLKNIRANEKTKDIPFIMVTAESKTDNVIEAKEAGVNNYIVKPFNAETLRAKLVSVLGEF